MFFPMTNWGEGANLDKKEPPSDPKRPSACALRNPNNPRGVALCGRSLEYKGDEFVFQDARRARALYGNPKGPGLRLCRECAAAWIAENPKETKS